jgi:hypothetical protein
MYVIYVISNMITYLFMILLIANISNISENFVKF